MRRLIVFVLLACALVVGATLRAQDPSRGAVASKPEPTSAPSDVKPLTSRGPAPSSPTGPARISPTRPALSSSKGTAPVLVTPASVRGFESVVKPFVSEFCYPCHGNKGEPKNGLNIQSFQTVESLINQRNHWEDIVGMLKRSEMPPMEEEQPEEKRRQAVATWVARELARIDRVTPPDPGRVTARRLNRAEYNNTIRELLGIESRPADDFPQDDSGYGFDNIADVLSLSPVLMEKYVTAADRVAREAVFGPPVLKPTLTRLRAEPRRVSEARAFPARYDVTGLSMPNAFHGMHRIPVEGEYLVRVFLGGLRPINSDPITIALWVDDREVATVVHDAERYGRFEIDRQDFGGQTTDFRIKLDRGDRKIAVAIPRIFEGLPVRYNGPNPSQRPDPPREFKPPPDTPPDRLPVLKKRFDEAQAVLDKIALNGVRVANVEVGGPYSQVTAASAESAAKIYTCGHQHGGHQPACVRRIMTSLAARAFRRPVTSRELNRYVALVHEAQEKESSFDEGLVVGIQAILVSPDFLFRIERDRPATAAAPSFRITQHELATRLSYFLWASMPDAALRRAADAGTLRNPQVLAAQVQRMLRDPRSRALAENFAGQWLQFRALESVTRDRDKFPEFEDYLRLSMRRETELFVEHIIRNDRSILDFVDGRYSFLNERLARHYGIDNVTGPEFRRVDLDRLTARRRGDSRQRPDRLLLCDAHVARAARQVDSRQPARCPAARSAGRRAEPRRDGDRHLEVDARAAGRAPQEPDVRLVPPPDGPARIRAGELRRRRRVADDGRQAADRRVGHAARRPGVQRAGGTADHPDVRSGRLRAGLDVQAADLRARPGPGALRLEDDQIDREPAAGQAVPVLGAGPGDRQQSPVPIPARFERQWRHTGAGRAQ